MDPSDTDYDPDPERETNSDGESDRLKEEAAEKPVSQLDFYQADPFTHGDRMYHTSAPCVCVCLPLFVIHLVVVVASCLRLQPQCFPCFSHLSFLVKIRLQHVGRPRGCPAVPSSSTAFTHSNMFLIIFVDDLFKEDLFPEADSSGKLSSPRQMQIVP